VDGFQVQAPPLVGAAHRRRCLHADGDSFCSSSSSSSSSPTMTTMTSSQMNFAKSADVTLTTTTDTDTNINNNTATLFYEHDVDNNSDSDDGDDDVDVDVGDASLSRRSSNIIIVTDEQLIKGENDNDNENKNSIDDELSYQYEYNNKDNNNFLPGLSENHRFNCDKSVAMWGKFQSDPRNEDESVVNVGASEAAAAAELYTVEDNLKHMNRIIRKFLTMDGNSGRSTISSNTKRGRSSSSSISYFSRHIVRTAYFIVNALLGTTAYNFKEKQQQQQQGQKKGGSSGSMIPSTQVGSRILLEVLLCYDQDYECIQNGVYKEPWDMTFTPFNILRNRQSNPIYMAQQTNRFIKEAIGTLGRRSRAEEDDKKVQFFIEQQHRQEQQQIATKSGVAVSTTAGENSNSNSSNNNLYPDYYQTAFHYQGDGWMSTDSANVYETSTETLFLGRQDSMQRTTLPPIMELLLSKQKMRKKQQRLQQQRPMRVLEVACGTGRFMTFVRDNLPLDTQYTAIDLSQFYLQKASENDQDWRKFKMEDEKKKQQPPSSRRRRNGIGVLRQQRQRQPQQQISTSTIDPVHFIQASAENLPFEKNSFDVVICVYLFHELPRSIRSQVAAEMSRVVNPGGTVVLTDSIQKGDRCSTIDQSMGKFQNMNEPYYLDYIVDDIGSHFEKQGLLPMTKIVRSTTKSLSFTKPGHIEWTTSME